MTTEERFERIEHITAGLAEERRKDREDNRELWRDTQRQIQETNGAVAKLAQQVDRYVLESNTAIGRLEQRIERLAEESRAADDRLGGRIDSLVSAIGKLLQENRGRA